MVVGINYMELGRDIEYVAYRVNNKRGEPKVFTSGVDAAQHFGCNVPKLKETVVGSHRLSDRIGVKWLLFKGSQKLKYVEEILNTKI